MKSLKQDQSISPKTPRVKLTPKQRELLININTARVHFPSIEELIEVFDLPITKQAIQHATRVRRAQDEK